jgi:hypothetical protein
MDGGVFIPTIMKVSRGYPGIDVESYFVGNFAQ